MTKLNKEIIVAEALALIDEEGEKALSMRALATRLDVSAMSLYTYFSSREDLVNAALGLMRQEYDNKPIPGEFWEDTVRRTTTSMRDVALRHPKAFRVAYAYDGGYREHMSRIFALHRDQGIPLELYSRFFATMEAYLCGFITHEVIRRYSAFTPAKEEDSDCDWPVIEKESYDNDLFMGGVNWITEGAHVLDPEGAATWRTPEDPSLWTWK